METARSRFRALLDDPEIIVQPLIFDALTARMAEVLGFKAAGLGGYQMAAHLTGVSEPLLSVEDVATCTRYVTTVCSLPMMVDAGAGFGDAFHTMRATRVLEHAGAASIHIEDQIFPKRAHYHKGIEHVVPIDEMVRKLKAALAARKDPDFVIVARTDGMRTDGYDEGIRRAQAYAECGADMVMIFPNDLDEAERAPRDLAGIHVVYVNSEGNRLGRPVLGARQLETFGYKVAAYPITLTNAAVKAVRSVLVELLETGRVDADTKEVTEVRKFIEDTLGLEEAYKLEEETVELGVPAS